MNEDTEKDPQKVTPMQITESTMRDKAFKFILHIAHNYMHLGHDPESILE